MLEYVQGRIVVFLDHIRELIQLLLAKWESLTEVQKRENAAYIIPEVRGGREREGGGERERERERREREREREREGGGGGGGGKEGGRERRRQ